MTVARAYHMRPAPRSTLSLGWQFWVRLHYERHPGESRDPASFVAYRSTL